VGAAENRSGGLGGAPSGDGIWQGRVPDDTRTAPTFDGHIARWYAHEGNEIRSRSPNFVSGPFSISTSWLRMSVHYLKRHPA